MSSDGPAQAVAEDTDVLQRIFAEQARLCHKINNPLTTISGRAQILQLKHGADPALARVIQVIGESADRIAGYVREMAQLVCDGREVVGAPAQDGPADV